MVEGETLRRHALVRLHPAAWPGVLAGHRELGRFAVLAEWGERGWPLVVRRPAAGEAPETVPLGLPLPPAAGKPRLGLAVDRAAIAAVAPPPLLTAAVSVAPERWRPSLRRLAALDRRARVFGSLAWQYLTGLPYLGESSDVDLLWPFGDGTEAERLVAGIERVAGRSPMRIDGELVDGRGAGVNWRELASGAPRILAKSLDGVALVGRTAFLEGR